MDRDLVFVRRTRGLPAIKQLPPDLCNLPSTVVNIDNQGRIFLCLCEAWVPWTVGHLLEFESMQDIWQHPVALDIAHSQHLGEYKYCDTKYCNVENEPKNQSLIQLLIGIDDSCQLVCPSCRKDLIFDKDYDDKLPWVERIVSWLQKYEKADLIKLVFGSHGDPFASRLYRKIISDLANLTVTPMIHFHLRTNGLLLSRYLDELGVLPRLTQLEISIDAATQETYEQVRRPGRWQSLIENLDYCLAVRKHNPFQVKANFVVQQTNYQEIPKFVELCRNYKMMPNFTLLQNWNTFSYRENAVHLKTHPEYQQFVAVIQDPLIKSVIGKRFDAFT